MAQRTQLPCPHSSTTLLSPGKTDFAGVHMKHGARDLQARKEAAREMNGAS